MSTLRISIWHESNESDDVGVWKYNIRSSTAERGEQGVLMYGPVDTGLDEFQFTLSRCWHAVRHAAPRYAALPQNAHCREAWISTEEGDGWEYLEGPVR